MNRERERERESEGRRERESMAKHTTEVSRLHAMYVLHI